MAQVIKGLFPKTITKEAMQDVKPAANYILKISIVFSDPLIWRRIRGPALFTLSQLHKVIQQSMGWSDSHVHQFLVGKICYEPTMTRTSLHEAKRFDENKYKLCTLEEDMGFLFTYLYGAGESWEHEIHLEEVIPPTLEPQRPFLLAGERACPPETVGDIHEYQALIAALETPSHKNHNRLFELTNDADFDPAFFDLDAAKKRVDAGLLDQ